jgi:nucleotide-binding universal stress UspA family protein
MPAADNATRIGGVLAAAGHAETTLLGIAEKPVDEMPLREAVETQADLLKKEGVTPRVVIGSGEPVREILNLTEAEKYDLVVIGSRRTRTTGLYWRTQRTFEVIKAIPPPVLVSIGENIEFKRLLVCTGGKEFIAAALEITGQLAIALGATVTLLHVMAEPPAMYADLVEMEEDLDRLLESKSELGANLRRQKQVLEHLGVTTEVRIRHGIVVDEVLKEARSGDHQMIVTGSSQGRGMVRHYVMGDLTRVILNRAHCPVLVARSHSAPRVSLVASLKKLFARPGRRST